MKRPAILLSLIVLLILFLFLWLGFTQSGLQWIYPKLSSHLPQGLTIHKVDGRLFGPLYLQDISFSSASDNLDVQADKVAIDWNPLALLFAQLDIQSLQLDTLKITRHPTNSQAQSEAVPDFKLPFQSRLRNIQITRISVIENESHYAFDKIEVQADTVFNQLSIRRLKLIAPAYEVSINGDIELTDDFRHRLQAAWKLQLPSKPLIQGKGDLQGSLISTQLTQQVDGPFELNIKATLNNIADNINWTSEVKLKSFDSVRLDPQWPDFRGQASLQLSGDIKQQKVVGQLQAENAQTGGFTAQYDFIADIADQSINIKQLTLASKKTSTVVNGNGLWKPDQSGGRFDLALSWQNLKWPQKGQAWFASEHGSGTLVGSLENYQFSVETDRPWIEAPPSHWQARGRGNLQGIKFDPLTINFLDGKLNSNGQIEWADGIQWEADVAIHDINPGKQWSEWSGQLSGSMQSKGHFRENKLAVFADELKIEGKLRDFPLDVNGKMHWSDDVLAIDQLRVKSAQSRVNLGGKLGDDLSLQWTVDSQNLTELHPGFSGQLQAQGSLSGTREKPLLQSSFSGTRLQWQQWQATRIEGSGLFNIKHWHQSDINLSVEKAHWQEHQINSIKLITRAEDVDLQIHSDEVSAQLLLKGSLKEDLWQGELLRAEIMSQRFDNWHLQESVALVLGLDHWLADELCLSSEQNAIACGSVSMKQDQSRFGMELKQIPLALLEQWLPNDLELKGKLNATADFSRVPGQQLKGNLQLDLPAGAIQYPLLREEFESLHYQGGRINAQLNDQGITSTAHIDFNEKDRLLVRARLPAAKLQQLSMQQNMQMYSQFDVHNIGFLSTLIPETSEIKGSAKIKMTAKGTLANPAIDGSFDLDKGSFKIPRLGLEINQFGISGQTDRFNQVQFQANAHSGDGQLALKGSANLQNLTDWSTEFTVTGQNFEVSKIPEARIQVSPDVQFKVKPYTVNVEGKVHVPYARLSPKDISSAVNVSDDVVIIGIDEPVQPEKWSINSRIRVTLDPAFVNFQGFGFEGKLGGSLVLEDSPGQPTIATGEILVPEGKYRAYGQNLSISNGRLLFAGGPISNPGLDFRAIREINDVIAGLNVSGSLQKPSLQLFSVPAMGQTDTLSYLVLGRPIESSSEGDGQLVAKAALALGLSGGERIAKVLGDKYNFDEVYIDSNNNGDQASLIVGRYLSPKLYVSYGVGLIESINTFNLRYQLNKKWQLQVESGEAQGADLLYTIER